MNIFNRTDCMLRYSKGPIIYYVEWLPNPDLISNVSLNTVYKDVYKVFLKEEGGGRGG